MCASSPSKCGVFLARTHFWVNCFVIKISFYEKKYRKCWNNQHCSVFSETDGDGKPWVKTGTVLREYLCALNISTITFCYLLSAVSLGQEILNSDVRHAMTVEYLYVNFLPSKFFRVACRCGRARAGKKPASGADHDTGGAMPGARGQATAAASY